MRTLAGLVTVLVLGACSPQADGEVLHHRFGVAGAIAMMRSIIDNTEAALITVHGQQAGEGVQ